MDVVHPKVIEILSVLADPPAEHDGAQKVGEEDGEVDKGGEEAAWGVEA